MTNNNEKVIANPLPTILKSSMQNQKLLNVGTDMFYCEKLGKKKTKNINIYCIDINLQVEARKKGWGLIYI